jgi:hypothetical protein
VRVAGAAAQVLTMLLASAGAPGAPAPARAAAAEYAAAAAADLVSKKKSRLGRAAVEQILQRAPHAAFGLGAAAAAEGTDAPASAAAVLARAAAAGRTDFVRAEALELLALAVSKAPADLATPALRQLQQQRGGGGSVATALVSGVQGPFKTKERHAAAAKAAAAVVEAAKKLLPAGGRLGELLGPDALTGMAKAVAAVRVSFLLEGDGPDTLRAGSCGRYVACAPAPHQTTTAAFLTQPNQTPPKTTHSRRPWASPRAWRPSWRAWSRRPACSSSSRPAPRAPTRRAWRP